jgi:hypothetical protein
VPYSMLLSRKSPRSMSKGSSSASNLRRLAVCPVGPIAIQAQTRYL